MAYKKLKYWMDKELAILLAEKIQNVDASFNGAAFVRSVEEKVGPLEFKDRVECICDELHHRMGADYQRNLSVLLHILGPENPNETGMFTSFYWVMPIAKYIEKYGLNSFEISMHAIAEITKRNTGEFAIRPFLRKYPHQTLAIMQQWSTSKNVHERRLASEGLRPRLPWARKLLLGIEHPELLMPVFENLKDDPSRFVQKSVANCINDLLKDNAPAGKAWVMRWSTPPLTPQRRWILNHALRNHRKKQDAWALDLLKTLP